MMSFAELGKMHNQQHRIDDALGVWTKAGKGRYENYDGWALVKVSNGGWVLAKPDGTMSKFSYRALWACKLEAESVIAGRVPFR